MDLRVSSEWLFLARSFYIAYFTFAALFAVGSLCFYASLLRAAEATKPLARPLVVLPNSSHAAAFPRCLLAVAVN
jgi:hypothetical protein